MKDLIKLDQCRNRQQLPPIFFTNPSPLQWRDWSKHLSQHPDSKFIHYITQGIKEGFRIGFSYDTHKCISSTANLLSARQHPEVVRDYLLHECSQGRVIGPLDNSLSSFLQINRFGVIPKKNSDRWRLILDLSAPEGKSVNDGIDHDLCSLSYVSIDNAAEAIVSKGRGAYLAKIDIQSAYRIVPVHPDDRPLLGMSWEGSLYFDAVLPFGLCSAPKIFTAIADALQWIVQHAGVPTVLHYLDDFLIISTPNPAQCHHELQQLLSIFSSLQVPVASDKLEGPTTKLTFLGIELDTSSMTKRLPLTKLTELKATLAAWLGKKYCLTKDLQSLTGKLQHACKVVQPGRTFLRRMFELLKGTNKKHRFVRLNTSFRSDLLWWLTFLESWNGVAMLEVPSTHSVSQHAYSDASGVYGCGAWWQSRWFQFQWPQNFAQQPIATKELLPIVLACLLWGKLWRNQCILVHSDNEAVVAVINSGYSKDNSLMQLLRCLFFIKAYFEISLSAIHIKGEENVGADAISRNNLFVFFAQVPQADPYPTPIPQSAVDLLVLQQPDWLSPDWSQLFKNCLWQV